MHACRVAVSKNYIVSGNSKIKIDLLLVCVLEHFEASLKAIYFAYVSINRYISCLVLCVVLNIRIWIEVVKNAVPVPAANLSQICIDIPDTSKKYHSIYGPHCTYQQPMIHPFDIE